jgi:hypothetical protein
MTITTFEAWIEPDDYQDFKRIIPNNPDVPDAYDEWLYLTTKKILEGESRREVVQKVKIDPNKFVQYCRLRNIACDSAALRNFAYEIGSGTRMVDDQPCSPIAKAAADLANEARTTARALNRPSDGRGRLQRLDP